MVWCGARNGRVVTKAVRSPVRPATLWIRMVSMVSARVIAGGMVVSRRASLDWPALAGEGPAGNGQPTGSLWTVIPPVRPLSAEHRDHGLNRLADPATAPRGRRYWPCLHRLSHTAGTAAPRPDTYPRLS